MEAEPNSVVLNPRVSRSTMNLLGATIVLNWLTSGRLLWPPNLVETVSAGTTKLAVACGLENGDVMRDLVVGAVVISVTLLCVVRIASLVLARPLVSWDRGGVTIERLGLPRTTHVTRAEFEGAELGATVLVLRTTSGAVALEGGSLDLRARAQASILRALDRPAPATRGVLPASVHIAADGFISPPAPHWRAPAIVASCALLAVGVAWPPLLCLALPVVLVTSIALVISARRRQAFSFKHGGFTIRASRGEARRFALQRVRLDVAQHEEAPTDYDVLLAGEQGDVRFFTSREVDESVGQ